MEQIVLEAVRRGRTGKGPARQARRSGMVPSVVYGLGREPIAVGVSRHELEHIMARHRGSNLLFDLRVEGMAPEPGVAALVKSVQRHPVSRELESVDFQWVSLQQEVTVSVPVVLVGESQAEDRGGVVQQLLHEVEISCRPHEIPEQLEMNVEGMQLGSVLKVADILVPPGVTILTDADTPVVTCMAPSAAEPEAREGEPVEGEITEAPAGEQGGEREP